MILCNAVASEGRLHTIVDLLPNFSMSELALMIFSSDRDFTLWPKAGTKLTVDLAGTSLELPVVGGAQALAEAVTPKAD